MSSRSLKIDYSLC